MKMSSKDNVEVSDKTKPRRTIKVDKQPIVDSNSGAQDVKPAKSLDIVKRIFSYEEEEAGRRKPEEDLQLHQKVCAELRSVMARIQTIKSGNTAGVDQAELTELKTHGILQFVSLKKLNRIAHLRSKKVRDATSEEKLKVDQHHLKLQNLLYEVTHLQKEISKCLEFKSKDQEISLIPVEQFYKEASPDVLKSAGKDDEHRLMLARLDWELEQRKRLSTKLTKAAGMKDKIMADVKKKKDFLESLQPRLVTILQATKPVQEQLSMPFDTIREQHHTAAYLPSPLYVLYMQATAYAEACDKNLLVTINGDIEAARNLDDSPWPVEDVADEDTEEQESAAEMGRRRVSAMEMETNRLHRKHPLSICLQVTCRDGSRLLVTFWYLLSLKVVSVGVRVNTNEVFSTISGGDLLLPDTVLSCLYPLDYGNKSPNPANNYIIDLGDFSKHIAIIGRPYQWAQWLCGLQFLVDKQSLTEPAVSASHMSETVDRLRRRVIDRLSLQKQLATLETCRVLIPSELISHFPAKISSRIVQWKRSTYTDFIALGYTKHVTDVELARSEDMYFTCVVERGSASLTANIVLSADYPRSTSLMVLALTWHGVVHTAANDEAIREMEAELNVPVKEPWLDDKFGDSQFLSCQVQRLLICLDVYLETSGSIQRSVSNEDVEFPQERICSRLTRGRSRARPFVYKYQLCFFTQR